MCHCGAQFFFLFSYLHSQGCQGTRTGTGYSWHSCDTSRDFGAEIGRTCIIVSTQLRWSPIACRPCFYHLRRLLLAKTTSVHLSGSYRLMDVALLPLIPRSSSLPITIPAKQACESPCCPSPHLSAVMVLTDSATPPSSPRKALLDPELTIPSQPPYTAGAPSDHSSDPSPPHSPPLTESAPDHDMDLDCEPPLQPTNPPVRLLDNEEEHIHRSLRLKDFEVRGTLGTSIS